MGVPILIMYTFEKAFGITNDLPKGLTLVNIEDKQTNELVKEYSRLIIVVKDSFLTDLVSIDFMDYFNDLQTFSGTIQDWLNTKSNVPLITSNIIPKDDYSYVTCGDLQYKWFSLYPGDIRLADDRQVILTTSSAPDIVVRRTDGVSLDYNKLVDYSLYTVNGHLTRAIADEDKLFLLGAGKHFNVCDNFHVNALNFYGVSKLSTVPLTQEDLRLQTSSLGNVGIRLKSPVNTSNKKVFMSIMGRLFLTDVVTPTGNDVFKVNINKVDWFSLLFDSKRYIDVSDILPPELEVVTKDFFNEEFFTKLLTHTSTFLIVLDNPEVDVYTKPITTYLYPFTYHTTETRDIPLLTAGGLLPKYFVRKIINRRLLDIDLGNQKVYLNRTTGIGNEGNLLHGYVSRFNPSRLNSGYQLYIRGLSQL